MNPFKENSAGRYSESEDFFPYLGCFRFKNAIAVPV